VKVAASQGVGLAATFLDKKMKSVYQQKKEQRKT
jgi:hypothetical protein